jgi:predicted membrane channel-forming protein YqfA (hemolysin III family)
MVTSSSSFLFAKDFFPDAVKIVLEVLKYFNIEAVTCKSKEFLLPVQLFSTKIDLRNPDLLPFQLAGLLIGLAGAVIFLPNSKRISKSWFWAMLFFACMNASSIYCHNLTKRESFDWNLARIADIIFTGSSSTSLAFIALGNVPHIYHFITFLVIAFYGILGDLNKKMIPFTAELIYIGMMIFALIALAPRIFAMTKSVFALAVALSGVFVILAGPIFDTAICRAGFPFSTVHAVFMGSDLALLGLLLIGVDMQTTKLKTD